MTTELHLGALLTGVHSALAAGAPAGTSVYTFQVLPGVSRPYWLVEFVAGGDLNFRRQRDASITLQVKCVSESIDEAMQGAAQIDALLDNKGTQDVDSGALNGGDDWIITTSTAQSGSQFMLPEFILDESKTIYHVGKTYQFVLEAR